MNGQVLLIVRDVAHFEIAQSIFLEVTVKYLNLDEYELHSELHHLTRKELIKFLESCVFNETCGGSWCVKNFDI